MADTYECAYCKTRIVQLGGVPRRDEHGECERTSDGTHSWRRVS